jgi:hypothetical protein
MEAYLGPRPHFGPTPISLVARFIDSLAPTGRPGLLVPHLTTTVDEEGGVTDILGPLVSLFTRIASRPCGDTRSAALPSALLNSVTGLWGLEVRRLNC